MQLAPSLFRCSYKRRTTIHEHELELESANLIMLACKKNAQKLGVIFEKVVPGDDASWLDRYWKAAQEPGEKHKVEDSMKAILEKLQLLHTNRLIKKRSKELDTAIRQLSSLSPSLPEGDSCYSHFGPSVNSGAGVQRNYDQSGGWQNEHYNAGIQCSPSPGRYSHFGSGTMNINSGAGVQRNYDQSDGLRNKQYNADTQYFRDN